MGGCHQPKHPGRQLDLGREAWHARLNGRFYIEWSTAGVWGGNPGTCTEAAGEMIG